MTHPQEEPPSGRKPNQLNPIPIKIIDKAKVTTITMMRIDFLKFLGSNEISAM